MWSTRMLNTIASIIELVELYVVQSAFHVTVLTIVYKIMTWNSLSKLLNPYERCWIINLLILYHVQHKILIYHQLGIVLVFGEYVKLEHGNKIIEDLMRKIQFQATQSTDQFSIWSTLKRNLHIQKISFSNAVKRNYIHASSSPSALENNFLKFCYTCSLINDILATHADVIIFFRLIPNDN